MSLDFGQMMLVVSAVMIVVIVLTIGVYKGKVEVRPFRTSAVMMGMMLLGALWMALSYDLSIFTGADAIAHNAVVNAVVDVSTFMVVITGLVTSMTKLCDDSGDSEALAVLKQMTTLVRPCDCKGQCK